MPKKLESSTPTTKGSGHELDQSQAMVPEETVEMPVHPEPRNTHTAPQQSVKQILVQLNEHVLQEFNKRKWLLNRKSRAHYFGSLYISKPVRGER